MTAELTLRIDADKLARLDGLATSRQVAREVLLEEFLTSYLDNEERIIAHIQKGVAAADRGEFASEEEVEAIFQKYSRPA